MPCLKEHVKSSIPAAIRKFVQLGNWNIKKPDNSSSFYRTSISPTYVILLMEFLWQFLFFVLNWKSKLSRIVEDLKDPKLVLEQG